MVIELGKSIEQTCCNVFTFLLEGQTWTDQEKGVEKMCKVMMNKKPSIRKYEVRSYPTTSIMMKENESQNSLHLEDKPKLRITTNPNNR